MNGRVPQHDIGAERVVLSECLSSPMQLALVAGAVEPRHFFHEPHRRVFEAIVGLHGQGRAIDVVAVAGWLRDHERLAQVGGASALAEIVDVTGVPANVEDHAERVIDLARLRDLVAECQRIAAEGYAVAGDVQAFLDEAEQRIYQIAARESRTEAAPMSVVCGEAYERMVIAEARSGEVELPTGLDDLDKKIGGLGRSGVTVMAARPGMGKTTLATLAAETVAMQGDPVAFFSLEMPRWQLALRMACSRARASVHYGLNGWLDAEARARVLRAGDELGKLPIWIDACPTMTITQLRSKARMLAAKAGGRLGLIVVDYLQLMRGQDGGGRQTRDREVSLITAGAKQLAKELDCAVLLLSQLNRECEAERDKRPRLAHLRESGGIEQDADAVVFIYRDEYYNGDKSEDAGKAELIVAKQRNGPTGSVKVGFHGPSTSFFNLGGLRS